MSKSLFRTATLSAAALGMTLAAAVAIAPAANATSAPAVQSVSSQVRAVPAKPAAPSAAPAAQRNATPTRPVVGKGLHAFNATISNKGDGDVAVLLGWDGVQGHEHWQWLNSGGSLRMEQTASDSIDGAWVYFASDGKELQFTMGPWINPSFLSFGPGVIVDGNTHWLEEENSTVTGVARGHEFTATRSADLPGPGQYSAPTLVMGISFNR